MNYNKFVRMNTSGKHIFMLDSYNDDFLLDLGLFLNDHRKNIDRITNEMKDSERGSFGGNMMHMKWNYSSVMIFNPLDKKSDEDNIEIPRIAFIQIIEAWKEALKTKAQEVTFFRDEEHINMIANYYDGSEFRKTFNYKVK